MKRYSIKELQDRYDLKSRQSVYDRINGLNLEVLKEGNKSYVSENTVTMLDQLQQHLNLGGSIKTFTPTVEATVHPETDSVNSSPDNLTVHPKMDTVNSSLDSHGPYVQLELFQTTIETAVEKAMEKVIPANPIAHWEKLDQAAERGYILTSREVAQLLGTKPKGLEWTRGAFKFVRFGKIGNQTGWQVTRL